MPVRASVLLHRRRRDVHLHRNDHDLHAARSRDHHTVLRVEREPRERGASVSARARGVGGIACDGFVRTRPRAGCEQPRNAAEQDCDTDSE